MSARRALGNTSCAAARSDLMPISMGIIARITEESRVVKGLLVKAFMVEISFGRALFVAYDGPLSQRNLSTSEKGVCLRHRPGAP